MSAPKTKSFADFNDRHNATIRAFVEGAKQRAHAEAILKTRFGYSDEQLRTMVAANIHGIENYGKNPRGRAVLDFTGAVLRARQIQLARLMKRCNVKVP